MAVNELFVAGLVYWGLCGLCCCLLYLNSAVLLERSSGFWSHVAWGLKIATSSDCSECAHPTARLLCHCLALTLLGSPQHKQIGSPVPTNTVCFIFLTL
jgi:hypothetical protein